MGVLNDPTSNPIPSPNLRAERSAGPHVGRPDFGDVLMFILPPPLGHNELAVLLGRIADDAQRALERVASGEAETIEGWIAYGAALNEGRALHIGDREFGQWLCLSNLDKDIHPGEQQSAMWAARSRDEFAEARTAGNARTVRGIHAKWNEIDAGRKAEAARRDAEAKRKEAEAKKAGQERAEAAAKAAKDGEAREALQANADQALKEMDAAQKEATKAEKEATKAEKKAATAKGDGDTNTHVANNSGNNEWYTPAVFIEAARDVMGGIDLDPATSETANRKVKAAKIFTAENSGLDQDWPTSRIWMNPPYAQPLMSQFAEKFAAHMALADGSEGIVLVNNATETKWFQQLFSLSDAFCLPKSRIKFLDPDGNADGTPLQGQAIIYCGPNSEVFCTEFERFGCADVQGRKAA